MSKHPKPDPSKILNQNLEHLEVHKSLWGVTILMIASKFNEIEYNRIPIKKLVKRSKKAKYTHNQIVDCEKTILKILDWELSDN